jgi:predicted site-specific integrase-resolvase
MSTRHLVQHELARRWGISPRTLERWRVTGQGPRFLKVGKRINYRLDDVEAFEAERLRESTSVPVSASAPCVR